MSDLFDARAVPLHEQITAAERELRYRARVYPRLVSVGKMRKETADHEVAAMRAVLETLRGLLIAESNRGDSA